MANLKKQKLVKFHNLLLITALVMPIYVFFASTDWNFGAFFGEIYNKYSPSSIHTLMTFDKEIPLVSYFYIFYFLSAYTWIFFPAIIFVVYGIRRFSKLISVAICVYSTSLLIKAIFPVSSLPIEDYCRQVLEGRTGYYDLKLWNLMQLMSPYSCFPSDHCLNSLLLMYAFIDFNFFDKTKTYTPFNKQGYNKDSYLFIKSIWTTFDQYFLYMYVFPHSF